MKLQTAVGALVLSVCFLFAGLSPAQTDANLGSGLAGSSSYYNGVYTVRGSGWDIWNTADGFHFKYQLLTGDGTIIARISSLQLTSDWAKAGVMIRETLSTGAKHAFMLMSPGHGPFFEARACNSCMTTGSYGIASLLIPKWVKLVRAASTFTGYVSSDGYTWVRVGAKTISMASNVLVGLAVTSHDRTLLAAASFDHVQFPRHGIGVTITPGSAWLHTGATQTFSATVSGTTNSSVRWSASVGYISSTGHYIAPSTPGVYTIIATSAVDPSAKGTATVDVSNTSSAVSVSISPSSDSIQVGQSLGFTATVHNTSNTAVTWRASGGTISSWGLFTAKATGSYSVTATSLADPTKSATAVVQVDAPRSSNRLFTSSSADWFYTAPKGTGLSISSITSSLRFSIDTWDGGWNYPVQFTDATHGYTTFNDIGSYGRNDVISVPNPANGYWPSTGSDGHLVVVDTTHRMYYDFWQLSAAGHVNSTSVGQIVSGSLDSSNGTPGTTAAQITGLAGSILPGELSCETCLNHALSVVVPLTMNSPIVGHQAPAVQTDGRTSGGIFREGAKLRFDPSIDVSSLNASTAVKAILRALQLYGGVITDQSGGSGVAFYSALPSQPDTTGINLIGQHLLIYY